MSDSITILRIPDTDRRLLLKLQHRLLMAQQPQEEHEVRENHRRTELAFALAPMAFAFLYLLILSFFVFR